MSQPHKPVASLKHKADKRAHIPSAEEAGYEAASPKVAAAPGQRPFPRNPVVHRGQDPELFWMHKYGPEDDQAATRVDIRSLYRHEHLAPETLIKGLYRIVADMPGARTAVSASGGQAGERADKAVRTPVQEEFFSVNELFGNAIGHEELDKVSDYYTHSDGWTNRLIQGDSLLVMTSLLEREGMAGHVQCCYFDPPYGIKYGSNWQIKLNNRSVKDADDDSLSGEPEQIKAFRDTWELGIHSYLSYLRDRLLVAKELLHESGSCFVQISDENIHLVRCLMDEVFGSANFCGMISYQKTGGFSVELLQRNFDYILWYAKNKPTVKFRKLFEHKTIKPEDFMFFDSVELPGGERRVLTADDTRAFDKLPPSTRLYSRNPLISDGYIASLHFGFEFEGQTFRPPGHCHWKTTKSGMEALRAARRLCIKGNTLRFIRYLDDYPVSEVGTNWTDTGTGGFVGDRRKYIVQTDSRAVQRCLLLTTDPGDLVLDPTCGSGTTAFVAEQWGRRWITTDTSRIALNFAKTRLMTATFPYYLLYDSEEGRRLAGARIGARTALSARPDANHESADTAVRAPGGDLRQGFVYKQVPHITLGSIANNEPAAEETLYDQPLEDKKRLRVAGPFTVETLQSYEPISPEELARQREQDAELGNFENLIFEHLKTAGVKTGDKKENAVFVRLDRLSSSALHAEGWYLAQAEAHGERADTAVRAPREKKAYLHIGPKFGTVSKQAVTEAIKACRDKRDADWLLILGFAFESGITEMSRSFGNFQVSLVRMHDDLLQQGLLKRDKKAASFVTIGEPDIRLHRKNGIATVEIAGLDIYDPITDEVKSRDVHDIAYWMLDDNYDGSNFVVRQVFFCGGAQDEFEEWRKGLSDLAKAATKKKAEQTLKLQMDDDAFTRVYGHESHPFEVKQGQKIAIRVLSQFGEETTKVLEVEQ